MWDSLWYNATIATCAESCDDYGLLHNSALAVKAGKISWIGQLDAAPRSLAKEIFDLKGSLITPGLVECHTHLVYTGNRAHEFSQRLHGATYQAIAQLGGGILSTVRQTQAASFDDLYQESAARLQNLISNGVTTVEIKSGYGLTTEAEIKQLRVIQALGKNFPVTIHPTFLGLHALPPEYKGRSDEYVDYVCKQTLPLVAEQNLATAVDAFCENIAFTPAQVEKFFMAAQQHGLKVKLHAEQLTDSHGALLAAHHSALSADHLEHVNAESILAMSKNKTVAVLLPGAFYFLREKKSPPIALFREYGVPIAISTDCNPGTSPVTNLVLMMNMACVLWHLTPEEALRGTTINAAKALGIAEEYGSIEVNKAADFVIWQVTHPDQLCYRIEDAPERRVIKSF